MGRIILYIAISIDGYIADENGEVKFLDKFQEIDYGFDRFFDDIDMCVMGAKTYSQIISFGAKWPYEGKETIVYTNRQLSYPKEAKVCFRDHIDWLEIERLRNTNNIWVVGGANVATQFLEENKIDLIEIFEIPVNLSRGIKLGYLSNRYSLRKEKEFPNGVRYKLFENTKSTS